VVAMAAKFPKIQKKLDEIGRCNVCPIDELTGKTPYLAIRIKYSIALESGFKTDPVVSNSATVSIRGKVVVLSPWKILCCKRLRLSAVLASGVAIFYASKFY